MKSVQASKLSGRRIGLVTSSVTHLGGGVAEAVLKQATIVHGLGGTPVILTLDEHPVASVTAGSADCEIRLVARLGPRLIGYAPTLRAELDAAQLDCLHLHGIWQYPSRAAALWARATGRPYVISPHGMLDPWITARGRWKKALARSGYERLSWQTASLFHALTAREANDIKAATGRRDIAVIANAVPEFAGQPPTRRGPEVLYLGRIHPKKNLTALLAGWAMLAASGRLPPDARLTIAGWGEPGDVAILHRALAAAPPSVAFVGPVFGEAKATLLAKARFAILPSLSEGLPMSVLEAWAARTPVLMSKACNLPAGFTAGAALDCGIDPETIAAALDAALALPDPQWQAMSIAAAALAGGPFSAETIMQAWGDCYGQLLPGDGGQRW